MLPNDGVDSFISLDSSEVPFSEMSPKSRPSDHVDKLIVQQAKETIARTENVAAKVMQNLISMETSPSRSSRAAKLRRARARRTSPQPRIRDSSTALEEFGNAVEPEATKAEALTLQAEEASAEAKEEEPG